LLLDQSSFLLSHEGIKLTSQSDYQATIEACKRVDLLALIEPTTKLRKVAAREYAGPCPRCGGTDRFRVNVDKGWFCRQCYAERNWYDQIDFRAWLFGETWGQAVQHLVGRRPIDPEALAKIQHEREERERQQVADELAARQIARARLNDSRLWETYHANLDDHSRALWRARGLRDDWQDYYQVGYCPSREWVSGDNRFTSDSLTIPYLQYAAPAQFTCISLKHRLLATDAPGGKYRPEFAGLGNQLYTPWYEQPIGENVLIVEGEIKAMVTFSNLWRGADLEDAAPNLTTIGIAGMNAKTSLLSALDKAEKIYICLDPDARKQAADLARSMGADRCKVIHLPEKVDDLFVMGALTTNSFLKLLEAE
jgi:hypothetical protein